MLHAMKSFITSIIVFMVRIYQAVLSPLHKPSCRFQPTCSEYFIEAIKKKGIFLGSIKGVWRILRCNPLGGSGYDPV